MKYFLEFVIRALVEHHEEVDIEQVDDPRTTTFYVHIHPEDVGKVIGKNGRTISAIRAVLNAAIKDDDRRVQVEVMEEDEN